MLLSGFFKIRNKKIPRRGFDTLLIFLYNARRKRMYDQRLESPVKKGVMRMDQLILVLVMIYLIITANKK